MPRATRVERPIRDEYRGAYLETFAILAAHYPNGAPHALVMDVKHQLRADLRAAIEKARATIAASVPAPEPRPASPLPDGYGWYRYCCAECDRVRYLCLPRDESLPADRDNARLRRLRPRPPLAAGRRAPGGRRDQCPRLL